jgi:hypothetical protein
LGLPGIEWVIFGHKAAKVAFGTEFLGFGWPSNVGTKGSGRLKHEDALPLCCLKWGANGCGSPGALHRFIDCMVANAVDDEALVKAEAAPAVAEGQPLQGLRHQQQSRQRLLRRALTILATPPRRKPPTDGNTATRHSKQLETIAVL